MVARIAVERAGISGGGEETGHDIALPHNRHDIPRSGDPLGGYGIHPTPQFVCGF